MLENYIIQSTCNLTAKIALFNRFNSSFIYNILIHIMHPTNLFYTQHFSSSIDYYTQQLMDPSTHFYTQQYMGPP